MSQEEEASSKRQRISQACENCRKRKIKCDGGQPSCKICLSYDRICSYDQGNRKRGLQSGYVRSIETVLGTLIKDLPESELKLRLLLRNSDVGGRFFTTAFFEPVTELWHQSSLHDDIQELMKNADDKMSVDVGCLSSLSAPSEVDGQDSTNLTCDPHELIVQSPSADKCVLQLPLNASDLVGLYFSTTHFCFPIVERRDILHALHSITDYTDMSELNKGYHLCLCSIIIVMMIHHRSDVNDPLIAEQLLKDVRSQRFAIDDEFEIGHIQAALLLTLLHIGRGQHIQAWVDMGRITRMVTAYSSRKTAKVDRLPHIVCAAQVLDVTISILVDKPVDTILQQVDSDLDVNALEEWEYWDHERHTIRQPVHSKRSPVRAMSIFKMTSDLMHHLHSIMANTPNHNTAHNAIVNLRRWHVSLPSYCEPTEKATNSPCALNLRLFYNSAVLAVIKMTAHPQMLTSIIKDSARSILDSLRMQIELGGTTFPLLPAFARHASASVAMIHQHESDDTIRCLIEDLQKTGDELQVFWQRPQTEPVSVQSMLPSVSRSLHDSVDPLPLNQFLFAGLDTFNEFDNLVDNDFDTVLESLPIDMDTERNVSQHDFAQNLGFLTDNIDPQFLALVESSGNRPS